MAVIAAILSLIVTHQNQIVSYLSTFQPVSETQLSATTEQPAAAMFQIKDTAVSGLSLAYTPCPATFTGACDDAMLYKNSADGSKQVIIPSMRALKGSPLSGELLQPLSQSADGHYLVLGAWAFGSNPVETDKRIWIYDTSANDVVIQSDSVPHNAIFSPDYMYAAYPVVSNNDITDIMIVSFASGKIVSGAKPDSGASFKGPDGKAVLAWKDAKHLLVSVFTVPSGSGASSIPTKTGEITVTLK